MKPYYEESGITIYHGDALRLLPELSGDLVCTDPPYSFQSKGGGLYGEWGSRSGFPDHKQREYVQKLEELNCCDFYPVPFLDLVNAPSIVACMNKELLDVYIAWARSKKLLFDVHVMSKSNPIPAKSSHFLHDLEYLVVMRKPKSYFSSDAPFHNYRKLFAAYNDGEKLHPAQKPLGLMAKYIAVLCPMGGTVIDPYMGSGTTLLAAKNLGRIAIGVDSDEKCCEMAADRLRQSVMNFEEAV